MIRTLATFALACMAGLAQPQPEKAPPAASIEGRVLDAVTGAPIRGLAVSVVGSAVPPASTTDEEGRYAIRGLAAGTHSIAAPRAEGYVPKIARVSVVAGQELKNFDLRLEKEAVVAGRVLDRDKKPVAGAHVSVRRQGFNGGRPVLNSFHSTRTDDLGEYRISRLMPGKYYLEVSPSPLPIRKRTEAEVQNDSDKPPVPANITTYYMNAPTTMGATLLELKPGDVREGVDISLLRAETVCVTGKMQDGPDSSRRFSLSLSELYPMAQSRIASGAAAAGDDFEICGVPPGTYRLWSFATGQEGTRFGTQILQVGNRTVKVPPLYLTPMMPLAGRVTVADAKDGDRLPERISIRLGVKDRTAIQGENTNGTVDNTGRFVLPGVLMDEYWVNITGLPAGFYVRAVTMGGKDVWSVPARTGSGEMDVLLGSDGPGLSGQVVDKDGKALPSVAVMLAAASLPDPTPPNQLLTTTADQNGQFTFNGMPPGDYRLMAFTGMDQWDAGDPARAREYAPRGTEVTLAPRQRKSITISPVDAPR